MCYRGAQAIELLDSIDISAAAIAALGVTQKPSKKGPNVYPDGHMAL